MARLPAKTAAEVCSPLIKIQPELSILCLPWTFPAEVTIAFQGQSPPYLVPEATLTADLRVSCLIILRGGLNLGCLLT